MQNKDNYGIVRDGKKIKLENMMNYIEFPSVEDAEQFEKIFLNLAEKAVKDIAGELIFRSNFESMEKLLEQARNYFLKGGLHKDDSRTLDSVLERTWKLYKLSKEVDLIEDKFEFPQ